MMNGGNKMKCFFNAVKIQFLIFSFAALGIISSLGCQIANPVEVNVSEKEYISKMHMKKQNIPPKASSLIHEMDRCIEIIGVEY